MLRDTQIIRLRRSEAQAILEKWWREGMESDVRVLAWKAPGHVFLETSDAALAAICRHCPTAQIYPGRETKTIGTKHERLWQI